MQFSGLSNWNLANNRFVYKAIGIWANVCRFVLAAVFLFSGFVKANDPLGTVYKLQDYLEAWGLPEWKDTLIPYIGSMAMGAFEFTMGIYLLFGIRRRVSSILVLLCMCFMTPLTLWLALDNPISDCGCFGDAVILTNWETFGKNVILLIAAVSAYRWNRRLVKFVTDKVDWLIGLYTIGSILFFSLYCLTHLPILDFRPYYIGADIRQGMEIPEGKKSPVYETRFIYEKDGVQKEFTIDNFPSDSTWKFIDSKTILKEKGYEPPIHDFTIVSQEDGSDLTDEILDDESYTFLLVAPWLRQADEGAMDLINELYDYSVIHGYRFLCLTASGDQDIAFWQENTGAEYPFALMDEITLKTMVRSNPGVILLQQGVVVNKWSASQIPDEYQLHDALDKLDIGQVNRKTVTHKVVELVAWFVCPLLFFTLLDLIWLRIKAVRKKRREDTEREETKTAE